MTILEVCKISKSFGSVRAVNQLSFALQAGQICGFIGPNGAGKTTAMRICATLELPDSGDVLIGGLSVISNPREVRSKLGFMPDNFPMEPRFYVRDFIEFYARAYGLKGKKRSNAIQEVVEFTGLEPLLDKECESLSKGMRQRTALAATLLHEPELLILDEPAAGLDPRARVELRTLLTMLAEMGKAVLISSHILAELSEICDQVVVIEKGTLCGSGDVLQIQQDIQPHDVFFVQAIELPEVVGHFIAEQEMVDKVHIEEKGVYFSFQGDEVQRAELLKKMIVQGLSITDFSQQKVDLEEMFLKLTKGVVQ